jgi:hypothetical protein
VLPLRAICEWGRQDGLQGNLRQVWRYVQKATWMPDNWARLWRSWVINNKQSGDCVLHGDNVPNKSMEINRTKF